MQNPSGGQKDTNPPIVLKTTPKHGATNTSPGIIELEFDEFVKLKNVQNELLISPPLNTTPDITLKGKKLSITLYDELKTQNTYTFNFGKGIADFHEGNLLDNYSLVFSTGDELDSLFIKGSLNVCEKENSAESIVVGIYEKNSLVRDSTIYLQKPDYFCLLDDEKNFEINHIRPGTFELCAFEDVNANYQYDGVSEKIAFYKELIEIGDTTDFDLWLFKEEAELKRLDVDVKENGRIHFAFNKTIDTAFAYSSQDLIQKIEMDSLFIWPTSYPKDSFLVYTNVNGHIDSLSVQLDSLKKHNIKLTANEKRLKSDDWLTIYSNAPIVKIDPSKIKILSDSVSLDYKMEIEAFKMAFKIPVSEGQTYQVKIEKGAVLSTYENQNDSTNLSFYSKKQSALADLKINLNTSTENYFVELLKDAKVLERIEPSKNLRFNELLPGSYQIRITLDTNKDGAWSAGNYLKDVQPEKVFYYTEEINLRENWELEIDWAL